MKLFALCLTTALVGWSCLLLESPGQGQKDARGLPGSGTTTTAQIEQLFPKLFPKPTSQNGMEDYVAAADLVARSNVPNYQNWMAAKWADPESTKEDKEYVEWIAKMPFGDPWKTSALDAARIALQGLDQAKELVRRGNGRPLVSLSKQAPEATTVLSRIKSLVKYFALDANLRFSQGRSNEGLDSLIVGMEMNNRLPQGSFLDRVYSAALSGILLSEFDRHLDQLSATDAKYLTNAMKRLPSWEARLSEAIRGDKDDFSRDLADIREPPTPDPEDEEGYVSEWQKYASALSQQDFRVFSEAATRVYNQKAELVLKVIAGSERTWAGELSSLGFVRERPEPKGRTPAERGIEFAEECSDLWVSLVDVEAKTRTQLRLLRLHARILEYKWNEGRLPKSLDQAASAKEREDAFANGTFQYLPDRFGHYELFSKGFPPHGRIDLRWRRDPNAQRDLEDGPIPPRNQQQENHQ